MKMPAARRWKGLGFVALVALVAAACGGTASEGATTYKDPDYSLVEIPTDWQVYTTAELTGFSDFPFVVQPTTGALPILSQFTFAGTPTRDTSSLLAPLSDSPYPVGSATVRAIDAELREQISRLTLAELVLPYHAQPHQEFIAEDVRVDDFEGIKRVVVYTDPTTSADAAAILVSLTDPDDARVYSIGVGCSVDCFNFYSDQIDQIVDSWVVNTR